MDITTHVKYDVAFLTLLLNHHCSEVAARYPVADHEPRLSVIQAGIVYMRELAYPASNLHTTNPE